MAHWLLIEDQIAGANVIRIQMEKAGLIGIHPIVSISHQEFLDRAGLPEFMKKFDGCLLDIIDSGAQLTNRMASRFAAIHVYELLLTLGIDVPVVVYSSSAEAAYFKIPLYEYSFVRACMTTSALLDELGSVLAGESPSNAVPR